MSFTYEGDIVEAVKWLPYARQKQHNMMRIGAMIQSYNPTDSVMIVVRTTPAHIHIKAGGKAMVCWQDTEGNGSYFLKNNDVGSYSLYSHYLSSDSSDIVDGIRSGAGYGCWRTTKNDKACSWSPNFVYIKGIAFDYSSAIVTTVNDYLIAASYDGGVTYTFSSKGLASVFRNHVKVDSVNIYTGSTKYAGFMDQPNRMWFVSSTSNTAEFVTVSVVEFGLTDDTLSIVTLGSVDIPTTDTSTRTVTTVYPQSLGPGSYGTQGLDEGDVQELAWTEEKEQNYIFYTASSSQGNQLGVLITNQVAEFLDSEDHKSVFVGISSQTGADNLETRRFSKNYIDRLTNNIVKHLFNYDDSNGIVKASETIIFSKPVKDIEIVYDSQTSKAPATYTNRVGSFEIIYQDAINDVYTFYEAFEEYDISEREESPSIEGYATVADYYADKPHEAKYRQQFMSNIDGHSFDLIRSLDYESMYLMYKGTKYDGYYNASTPDEIVNQISFLPGLAYNNYSGVTPVDTVSFYTGDACVWLVLYDLNAVPDDFTIIENVVNGGTNGADISVNKTNGTWGATNDSQYAVQINPIFGDITLSAFYTFKDDVLTASYFGGPDRTPITIGIKL